MAKKNEAAYFAVFMKSESCDYYNGLYQGTAQEVIEKLKNQYGEEMQYMGEIMVDSDNKKAASFLEKLICNESEFY